MFGFGKKAKKPDGIDILIIKADEAKNRNIYQVAFPSIVANDVLSMLQKLEKSKVNKPELLGEIGGFRIITHLEALTSFDVLDDADIEAHPVQIQDFANTLLRRLEALDENGSIGDSDDLAFIMGELTMLRDGSFVPQT
ncbi:hypothetical protein [Brevibacillus centrosporus]|uniref:Uncharacterized protein n=1 Tax=Brevibacillus centrosporus TaxID=54910 RepID=A0A1I3ZYD9_9BACL|nr:hypothetical protein [Brevibacillus centrosporus]MEC2131766.1 hypothetical protein [Brevibacillus centrosporus]MED4908478.1 hypothetical protein [Brevibacillus centrosporus]RNB67408.1 hypothetical protein EDM55_20410 [Brevibacillus centrosporus]SFK49088.1 hypothetical protein SAMN05518846_11459 [Brevibacillus centrosporus]GED33586.1 hypothetical protein BCE02nite_47270 [Brevibacillus centrosporus]